MNKICFGCGAKLQSEDKNKIGYVPFEKKSTSTYCMRCFRMIHYGEHNDVNTPKKEIEIINKINKDDKFVLFLIDFLNMNESVFAFYKKIKKDKLLIVNKCELIPKHINRENIKKYIKNNYNINGDIKIKGGTNSHGSSSILNYLEKNNIKECYILGITNAGKSTLINDFIKETNTDVSKITVNNKKNTTIDFIRVKLKNGLLVIDSPGIVCDDFLSNDVVDKEIIARNFNMKENETLGLLDNKYYIRSENKTSMTFYTNVIAHTQAKKIYKNIPKLDTVIDVEDNTDLVLKGIGFISIKNKTKISINVDTRYIEIRKSMFGGSNENTSHE